MAEHRMLALDVGTSSMRTLLGRFDGARLTVEECGRFYHGPVETPGGVLWDMLGIHQQIEATIEAAQSRYGAIDSLSLDAWGTDMVALDAGGELLTSGVSTRDGRFAGLKEAYFRKIPRSEVYRRTGIQFLDWNTLYLLYSIARDRPKVLEAADCLLFAPDCFLYLLTGERVCDSTIASTSQMLDARSGTWDAELVRAAGVPLSLLLPPERGRLLGAARRSGIPAYSGCSHDTAAAVAGIPLEADEMFIVAGSWAMAGAELDGPILSEDAAACGFSNEVAVDGRIRFLKNSMGMWLIQESRREWARQGRNLSFAEIAALGAQAESFRSIVDVNDPRLQLAGDLPGRIRALCIEGGQPVPETIGEIVSCINGSLAMKFRYVKEQLERCTGARYRTIRVAAGGSQDACLCQAIADATGCVVKAGPVEASALGNCASQLILAGRAANMGEAREIISRSLDFVHYEPREVARAEETYQSVRLRLGAAVASGKEGLKDE